MDFGRTETKIYQIFYLIAFVVFPLYCVGHFDLKVWNYAVVWSNSTGAGADAAVPVKYTIVSADSTNWNKAAKATLAAGDLWLANSIHEPKKAVNPAFKPAKSEDLSPACEKEARKCRGIRWFQLWSFLGMVVFSGAALFIAIGLGVAIIRSPVKLVISSDK